jgi:hypothetical protein
MPSSAKQIGRTDDVAMIIDESNMPWYASSHRQHDRRLGRTVSRGDAAAAVVDARLALAVRRTPVIDDLASRTILHGANWRAARVPSLRTGGCEHHQDDRTYQVS